MQLWAPEERQRHASAQPDSHDSCEEWLSIETGPREASAMHAQMHAYESLRRETSSRYILLQQNDAAADDADILRVK